MPAPGAASLLHCAGRDAGSLAAGNESEQRAGRRGSTKIYIALMLLGVAAPLGVGMFTLYLRGKHVPMWLALTHGGFAGVGILLLAIAGLRHGLTDLMGIALGLFLVVGLAGTSMTFFFHRKGRRPPKLMMLAHGAAALTAITLLFIDVL